MHLSRRTSSNRCCSSDAPSCTAGSSQSEGCGGRLEPSMASPGHGHEKVAIGSQMAWACKGIAASQRAQACESLGMQTAWQA
eukprot:1155748-Pelagomonas_calceolata.AAC.8